MSRLQRFLARSNREGGIFRSHNGPCKTATTLSGHQLVEIECAEDAAGSGPPSQVKLMV